ncbi:MAG: hypothetical protein WCT12_05725 [Verrucomicrobiota bacterium]
MFGQTFLRHTLYVTATFCTMAAAACNVPVFRYALERWEADPYEIVVFHREPLSVEQEVILAGMEKAGRDGTANLTVNRVNLAGEVPPPLRLLWNAQENPTSPWMVARYPRQSRIENPAWAGPLTAETVGALLDSPARRDLARKLLRGDAVVWLLLESGDRERDDEAGRLIEAESGKLQQTLKLPEPSPLDPPMNANVPLKIAISIVRVARSDPAERMLVNLLLNRNPKLATGKEAMLFPIFGRGRAIPPAIGPEIRAEALLEMAEFLTGPCSCQVKEMNPGYDLLLTANWSSLIGYQELQLPEPPPLVSMSQFAATAASNVTATSTQASLSPAAAGAPPAPVAPDHLVRNLIVVLGAGACFLATMTFVLKMRANRAPR